jgi:hypothetical protein
MASRAALLALLAAAAFLGVARASDDPTESLSGVHDLSERRSRCRGRWTARSGGPPAPAAA